MNPEDSFFYRPRRSIFPVYQSDEFDSGFPSSGSSSSYGLLEKELKNEVIRSEKRRSALAESLNNAYHAIDYQENCLQQQDRHITRNRSTLEHLLMRQELLESRLSNLKHYNFYPDAISLGVSEKKVQPICRFPSEVTADSRINGLEREINDIKEKMRSYGSTPGDRNVQTKEEDGQCDKAQAIEIHEGLRQHAELMEAKYSSAQRERDVLELHIASLHSGLHQAKVTSKGLEKECVKLQSQIAANRNINESLHLEVSALKQNNHTLENAVKGSESENQSLHVQVESLKKEKQILASQKDLLYEIMKKKEKRKYSEKLNKRTPEVTQTSPYSGTSSVRSAGGLSFSELPQTARRRRRRKGKKHDSEDNGSSQSNDRRDCDRKEDGSSSNKEAQNFEENEVNVTDGNSSGNNTHKNASRRWELNPDIIVACYQHLADLLSKLECLKMSNVRLDHETKQILTFLLRTIKDFQDCKIHSECSREQVEELLNERMDLRENYHKRMNQITAVIIELKHLRRAYNGLLRHSEDPDDKRAIQWISRVQALMDSLKLLQEEQNLNPVLLMKKHQET